MSSRLFAIAVAVAIAGCSSTTQKRPRRPGQEFLQAIDIEGNTAIPDDSLIRGLSLYRAYQGGRGIDEYQLELDLKRIEGAYHKAGFFSVHVETQINRRGDAVTLIFIVDEGPQATAVVELVGLPPDIPADEARALVKLEDGEPFAYGRYAAAKAPLLALLENSGYAHAQVRANVLADRANNRATLRYEIDAGPRAAFGEITIRGATGELADVIQRRAGIEPGDPYSTLALDQAQAAIHATGLFTSVRVDVDRDNLTTVVPIEITVTEALRNEFRAGLGGGIDSRNYQARARFSYTHKGWPSPLTTLGVELRPTLVILRDNCSWYDVLACERNPRHRLIGSATQQDLFRRGITAEAEGGLDYLALEAFTVEGARVRLGLELPLLSRRFQARVGWQLGGYNVDELSPAIDDATAARLGIDKFQRVGAFTQGLVIDLRDDPVSPRFGGYAELRLAEGTVLAGGAFDYLQISPDIRGYVPLGPVVLAVRARLGVIRGDVPPTERYFAGGAASQRGFPERRLSPTATGVDADGNPIAVVIGGAALLETGIELRTVFKPGGYKLGIALFLDGADVTDTVDELDPGNLHWAAGIGLRPLYTAIGPVRLDAGIRLNRKGMGEPLPGDRWSFTISLGEAF